MQKVYLLFDALIKLLSYIPGHPGELSYLLLSFEQAVVGTLQVLQQGATNSVMLGDLLDMEEPFFIHHQLRAAHVKGARQQDCDLGWLFLLIKSI